MSAGGFSFPRVNSTDVLTARQTHSHQIVLPVKHTHAQEVVLPALQNNSNDKKLKVYKIPITGEFKVGERDNYDHIKVSRIASVWKQLALDISMRLTLSKQSRVFEDSVFVNEHIAKCLSYESEDQYLKNWYWFFEKIFVCLDEEQNCEAIALTGLENVRSQTKGNLGVFIRPFYLATNPKNIPSVVDRNEKSIKGAARTIIYHLAKSLKENQNGIYVESLKSSKSFYEKIGFEEIDVKDKKSMNEGDIFPMILRREKISKIFSEKVDSMKNDVMKD